MLTDSELDLVTTTSKIIVGSDVAGDVVFTGPISMAQAGTLEIITDGDITQGFIGFGLIGDSLILKGNLAPALQDLTCLSSMARSPSSRPPVTKSI